MKKRLTLAVLAAALLLTLTACKPTETTDGPSPANETTVATVGTDATTAPTDTTTTSASTSTTETTTTTAASVSNEPFVFTCDELNFSLTMPASWDGAFAHRHEGTVVSFYELSNHQYDSSGKLFTIRFISKEIDIDFPESEMLGTYGDYNVIAMYPTDVQFNYEDDAMAQAYLQMQNDVRSVVATFTYLG